LNSIFVYAIVIVEQGQFRREFVNMAKIALKPGHKAPVSGQYGIIDKDGRDTGIERTVVRGEPLPPTPQKEQTFVLKDRTKHK
jgi:hypothetical protein